MQEFIAFLDKLAEDKKIDKSAADTLKKYKFLKLQNIELTNEGMELLAKTIKSNDTNLFYISLAQQEKLTVKSLITFTKALKDNNFIIYLDFTHNNMPPDNIVELFSKVIEVNKTLKYLDLTDNNITINGAEKLLKSGKINSVHINLYHNTANETELKELGYDQAQVNERFDEFLRIHGLGNKPDVKTTLDSSLNDNNENYESHLDKESEVQTTGDIEGNE